MTTTETSLRQCDRCGAGPTSYVTGEYPHHCGGTWRLVSERPDGRRSVARGRGPIVLRVENGYGFHEHGTIGQAKAEAARLAESVGGTFVVYVPVAQVAPAPRTVITNVLPEAPAGFPHALDDDDLPF